MTLLIILIILAFLIVYFNASNSDTTSSGSSSDGSIYRQSYSGSSSQEVKRTDYASGLSPQNEPTLPAKNTINQPQTISVNPARKLSLNDGEYRYFQNHYIGKTQYTFGFPKENCKDKSVWIGINSVEVDRVPFGIAQKMIQTQSYIPIGKRDQYYITYAEWNGVGYCRNCNKKLRGNIYKKVCTACYREGFT